MKPFLIAAHLIPLILISTATAFAGEDCNAILNNLRIQTASLREEIAEASARDEASERPAAFISRLKSALRDTPQFLKNTYNIESRNTHIVSFGSGGDVLAPIYDFPLASDYHLVDLAAAWSSGPQEMISEIQTRLRSLAVDAVVTLEKKGFLAWNPNGDKPWREVRKTGDDRWEFYKKPAVWKVEWTSPSYGKQVRRVHLHVTSFNEPTEVDAILKTIPASKALGGLMVMGISLPVQPVLQKWIDRLQPNGFFHAEVYARNARGESSDEGSEALFEAILPQFSIETRMDRVPPGPFYSAHSYLLRKKN